MQLTEGPRELVWSIGREWRTPLIVVSVLGLTAVLVRQTSFLELGMLVALGSTLAVARWPGLGVSGLIFASAIVPFGISTGTETEVNATVLVVGLLTALWLLEMAGRRDVRLPQSAAVPPVLTFAGVAILAFIVGLQPWLPFAQTAPIASQAGGLAIFILSFTGFLVAAARFRNLAWLQRAVWLFLALAAMYMLKRAAGPILPLTLPDFARGADGSLFWLWTVALAFSQALFNRRLPGLARLALVGLAVLTMGLGFQNRDWNSGWVPGLVAIAVILCVGAPKAALPLMLILGVIVVANLPTLVDYFYSDTKQYDVLTRTAAWSILWQIVQINPILGTGFANYYWYTPLFSILGYNVRFNSHNNYVDMAAETGVLGLVCFVWFVVALLTVAWRLRERLPGGSFERAYVYGGLGGLVGMLVSAFLGDWVLPFVYNIGMAGFRASVFGWIFLGGLVAVQQAMQERPPVDVGHAVA